MAQHPSEDRGIKNERQHSALGNIDDLLIRVAAGLAFAIFAGYCLSSGVIRLRAVDFDHLQPLQISRIVSILSVGFCQMIITFLYVLRLRPVGKLSGAIPCATALLGGFLLSSFLLLKPREDLPLGVQVFGVSLIVIGNIIVAVVLLQLGRSFSILPEGRRPVTHGVYSVVRHPLYLAETVGASGLIISYFSPLALLLVAAWFALQIARTYYEEKVLKEHFPEYVDYAKKTRRLIPGVY